MDDILNKINEAYDKGISNPRFQKAINYIKEQGTNEKGKAKVQDKSDDLSR